MLRTVPRVPAAILAAALSGLLLMLGAGTATASSVRSTTAAPADAGEPVERGLAPIKAPLHKADVTARGQHDQSGVGPDLPAVVSAQWSVGTGWRHIAALSGTTSHDDRRHGALTARAPPC